MSNAAKYLDDGDLALYHGDAITVLQSLPSGIAQTCVTSPPYWGLRDYGTGTWTGGDADCDHAPEDRGGRFATPVSAKQASNTGSGTASSRDCRCGAQRIDDQLGLEATPSLYVERMVAIFREVRRVLRPDGTLWLNLGDSYAGSWSGTSMRPAGGEQRPGIPGFQPLDERVPSRNGVVPPGLKPKDLVGIPWRVAFALQADGWYLRSDIIWSKPNPMPESVTDRPTKSHEYLFLFSKQPRYFYDADAIREPATYAGKEITLGPKSLSRGQATGAGIEASGNGKADSVIVADGRNRRSVWTIATQPFAAAHFATFPEALVRPCILAGTKPGDLALDPFVGSGTTTLVARKHGRRCIGIDLSAEYLAIAARRTQQLSLLGGVA